MASSECFWINHIMWTGKKEKSHSRSTLMSRTLSSELHYYRLQKSNLNISLLHEQSLKSNEINLAACSYLLLFQM